MGVWYEAATAARRHNAHVSVTSCVVSEEDGPESRDSDVTYWSFVLGFVDRVITDNNSAIIAQTRTENKTLYRQANRVDVDTSWLFVTMQTELKRKSNIY